MELQSVCTAGSRGCIHINVHDNLKLQGDPQGVLGLTMGFNTASPGERRRTAGIGLVIGGLEEPDKLVG